MLPGQIQRGRLPGVTSFTSGSPWFRRFQPSSESPRTLLCLPHAGGAAGYYRSMASMVPPAAEVLAVQYPGRQDRFTEERLTRIDEFADRVTEAALPWTGRPVALFGHSMGAVIAFEVARRLENEHGVVPEALFVSASRAPSVPRTKSASLLDDEGLVEELREQGGTNPAVLDEPEMRELLLPTVRSDFAAVERYRAAVGTVVSSPVVALTGSDDPETPVEGVAAWGRHTSGGFEHHVFAGGHFYLTDHQQTVVGLIKEKLGSAPAH